MCICYGICLQAGDIFVISVLTCKVKCLHVCLLPINSAHKLERCLISRQQTDWQKHSDAQVHMHKFTLRFNGHFYRWTRISQMSLDFRLHLFPDCASSWYRPEFFTSSFAMPSESSSDEGWACWRLTALSAQIGYIAPCPPRKLILQPTYCTQMAKPGFEPGPSAVQASSVIIELQRRTFLRWKSIAPFQQPPITIQVWTQSASSLYSTRPNHLNLPFFVSKLAGDSPKHSPIANISFLFFQVNRKTCELATAEL